MEKNFYDSDLLKLIAENGKQNMRFFVPMRQVHAIPFIGWGMTSSNDPLHYVECYIDESQYKVEDGYKIQLRACDQRFGSEKYYTCDLASHIAKGIVRIKNYGDYVEEVTLEEPIGGCAVIRTTFEVVANGGRAYA